MLVVIGIFGCRLARACFACERASNDLHYTARIFVRAYGLGRPSGSHQSEASDFHPRATSCRRRVNAYRNDHVHRWRNDSNVRVWGILASSHPRVIFGTQLRWSFVLLPSCSREAKVACQAWLISLAAHPDRLRRTREAFSDGERLGSFPRLSRLVLV